MRELTIGNNYHGFVVTDVIAIEELLGKAYVMRHEATRARALWLACDDENKSFAIAFKTPPANDTGVFHILEHSVLCGSDKFPVKEPFVNLLKTSMQTFLNALTFADKTMYPVASTNETDLQNLMDVYLDAVLHPSIYHRPRIFEQEGWHYEIGDDDQLVYNGVVFNEMKGATSDPDDVLFLGLDRALFPDTPYHFESGGDPRAIPTLTYEEFIHTHARHYDLANSYVILYGDMDIERELSFIDERFATAPSREAGAPNPLPLQAPVAAAPTRVEMATAPENAAVALAYVIGTAADRERVLACDVLLDALAGSNEAPLKRAVLQADLADDFQAILVDGELQPRIVFQLKGAHEGVGDEFRTLVEETCARLATDGIGHDQLAASLAQAEFNLREQDFGSYPTGVALSMYVMSSWLYDDDRPVDYLRYEDALAHMKEGLDNGYFESLLRSAVCESIHHAQVELVPVEEGASAEEAEELSQILASLSEDERAHIKDEVNALRKEQEAPDAPEDLAKLPHLTLADIGSSRPEPKPHWADAPLPCLAHELDTRHIDYVYHYFDLRHLNYEDLPYVSVLCDLLGKLATKHHSAAELDTLVELNLGALSFFTETHGSDDDLTYALPHLVVGASALSEKVEQLATLPREVWCETLFDDTDRIFNLLQQRRIMFEQSFVNSGHAAALARLCTHFAVSSKITGCLGGVEYYQFLKGLLADWETRKETLPARLEDLVRRLFVSDVVTVSFTGSAEDRERFWQVGGTLGLEPDTDVEHRLSVELTAPCNEAFVIPSNVSFVSIGSAPSPRDDATVGTWAITQRVLAYGYLWNEVRVKGGAYGTGFRRTNTRLQQFWSYRDPNVDDTIVRYLGASSWLESWNPSEEDLVGFIVSAVASLDAPVKPRQLARRQDSRHFARRPEDWPEQVRKQELATTTEDIQAIAAPLSDLGKEYAVCVFGPREAIEASETHFDEVIELI